LKGKPRDVELERDILKKVTAPFQKKWSMICIKNNEKISIEKMPPSRSKELLSMEKPICFEKKQRVVYENHLF
jgi:hypothetical protein